MRVYALCAMFFSGPLGFSCLIVGIVQAMLCRVVLGGATAVLSAGVCPPALYFAVTPSSTQHRPHSEPYAHARDVPLQRRSIGALSRAAVTQVPVSRCWPSSEVGNRKSAGFRGL